MGHLIWIVFFLFRMLGKNEELVREYYWADTATKISALRIELIDHKTTH
jgi:hypothetical protein